MPTIDSGKLKKDLKDAFKFMIDCGTYQVDVVDVSAIVMDIIDKNVFEKKMDCIDGEEEWEDD